MMEMLRNGEKINTLEVQFTKFRLVELEKSEVWEENMSTYVLTSMFPDGIHGKNRELFQTLVTQRKSFAFVASEFEKDHGTTDCYFHLFLNMLEESGIHFENSYVVDGRMDAAEARKAVSKADVVWLAGGDTPVQYAYLVKYGLDDAIRKHPGLIIGMSAGSIDLGKTAICTLTCRHNELEIYNALGCVDISVEPHFDHQNVTDELMQLSKEYTIYGLCDDSVIVCSDEKKEFYGEVYKLSNGTMEQLET